MNKKKNIIELINERRVYFDGGCGTLLQKRGLKAGTAPELWNLSHPSVITSLHRAYLEAGCDIIKTNTFGINSLKYEQYEELIHAAIGCAADASKDYPESYIAFDIGPTGKLLEPYGDLPFETAVNVFSASIKTAVECGVDLILIETMNDSYETKAAVLAAKESCDLPVFVTNVYDASGKLMTGADPAAMIAMLEGLCVDAIGINCSLGPDKMLPFIETFSKYACVPIIANPNAGLPKVVEGNTVYAMDSEEFSDYAVKLAQSGVNILGGCCGTDPEYIRKVIEKTKTIPLATVSNKNITAVSSYTHAVVIGESPILIGERINPTGKAKFKEALRVGDINYILGEGIRQADGGVHILDVNVGLPEIDEADMLRRCILALQSVIDLPLQIDTSDPNALSRAMRIYNGKPLVNSVNGKEESMNTVLPLVKKYGGVVIALTLDENGIPSTAEERLKIAEKIIAKAASFGLHSKDIIVDPLALTISSDTNSASVTLKTISLLRARGIQTSLGVSNISFGLPERERINSVFFASALESGLNCAIMNPFSEGMMNTYYAFRALHALDPACADYIAYASHALESKPSTQAGCTMTLNDCIVKGLPSEAVQKTMALLATLSPLDIINTHIIPALNQVGTAFEKGQAYLPQLLMSADAASAAFAEVKKKMPSVKSSGRQVILATVEGDIHDIGKNIVRVLLESYGFDVIDLGRDVPPQKVLVAVQESHCRLVGLSALMTTTVPAMERTIGLLHSQDPSIKVMVGGAVLNHNYAEMIGADYYSQDAIDTVRYAEKFYQ